MTIVYPANQAKATGGLVGVEAARPTTSTTGVTLTAPFLAFLTACPTNPVTDQTAEPDAESAA